MTAPAAFAALGEELPPAVVKLWPPAARSVGRARRLLVRQLDAWGLPQVAESAELVVSELVTNAITHAHPLHGNRIEARFERLARGVRIEVHDASDCKPEPREASLDAASASCSRPVCEVSTRPDPGPRPAPDRARGRPAHSGPGRPPR